MGSLYESGGEEEEEEERGGGRGIKLVHSQEGKFYIARHTAPLTPGSKFPWVFLSLLLQLLAPTSIERILENFQHRSQNFRKMAKQKRG